jgi:hypothetical protein
MTRLVELAGDAAAQILQAAQAELLLRVELAGLACATRPRHTVCSDYLERFGIAHDQMIAKQQNDSFM